MFKNRLVIQTIIQLIFIINSTYSQRQLKIGAIFNNDEYEGERAFRNAIMRTNIRVVSHGNIQFEPIIRRIDPTDSFQAQRVASDLISAGVLGIFGPSSSICAGVVASVCNEYGMPHILTHWTDEEFNKNRHNYNFTINFFPEGNAYSRAISQIVDDYDWKSFTVIYETAEGLMRLQDVLQLHGPDDKPVTVRQIIPGEDIKLMLKEIQVAGESRIILDCRPQIVLDILREAKSVKMLDEYQSYIITSLDVHTLDFGELRYVPTNITTLRMMNISSIEVEAAVYDWKQIERVRNIFMSVDPDKITTESALINDAVTVFVGSISELMKHNRLNSYQTKIEGAEYSQKLMQGGNIIKKMRELIENDSNFQIGMTGPIQLDEYGNRINFYMEVLEQSNNGFITIGIWNQQQGVRTTRTFEEVQSQIVHSLQNKTVIVVSRLGMPYLRQKDDHASRVGNDKYEGYSMDLIDGIAKILNFTYRFEIEPKNKYGSYSQITKQWDGLVKYLLDRKADLAICDLTITYERRTAVDFTMPFMTLGISILYAKPRKEHPGLFSFMSPLSIDVWLYMATAYLCMSVILFLLAKMAQDDWENPHPCNDEPEELESIWNMTNCTWLMVGSIMQQGCDLLPKAVSTRLAAGMWWFFALIVISSYTANLAAFLTMERMDESIESAEDLAQQTKIKYGAVKGGSTLSFFKESNFSTYQRMYAAMESAEPSVFAKDNNEGEERVAKGNRMYAFLMESTSIEYIVNRNCNLTQVGSLLDSKGYGIAMPMNSPYRTYISETVLKMQEEGKLHKLKNKWWKEKNTGSKCDDDKTGGGDTPELGMDNVGGVFLVLTIGVLAAIFIGIMEFLWNVRKVAIEAKITPWQAFKKEILFAIDVRITSKPVVILAEDNVSTYDELELLEKSDDVANSTGSFMHMNNI